MLRSGSGCKSPEPVLSLYPPHDLRLSPYQKLSRFSLRLFMFPVELRFRHDGVDDWHPVYKDLVRAFEAQMPPGDEVTLAGTWLGGNREAEVLDWVVRVDNFNPWPSGKQ